MIYLDTHVVVWLYAGSVSKLTSVAKDLLRTQDLFISPIVHLELHYLFEVRRIAADASTIVSDLSQRIGLHMCEKAFGDVVTKATSITWARDPFDRLIVANAALHQNILLSKDINIRTHYALAKWEAERL